MDQSTFWGHKLCLKSLFIISKIFLKKKKKIQTSSPSQSFGLSLHKCPLMEAIHGIKKTKNRFTILIVLSSCIDLFKRLLGTTSSCLINISVVTKSKGQNVSLKLLLVKRLSHLLPSTSLWDQQIAGVHVVTLCLLIFSIW